VEQQALNFNDYFNILKRRRKQFIYPFSLLFIITILISVLLPSIYRSSATILIESQDVPTDMIASTVTSYANERLQIISQRAMTTSNLSKIIKKYDLYKEDTGKLTKQEIIGNMRDDINLETVSTDVIDPRSGRPVNITIAFTISYDSKSSFDAQRVANELTSLYLTENIRERTTKATQTSSFLEDEGKKLKNKISDLEKNIANFKKNNINKLPESTQLNIQMIESAERDILEVQRQIRSIEERRLLLRADLAQINPYIKMFSSSGEHVMKPGDRLKVLEAEYVSKAALYSSKHPDLIKLKREIKSLRKQSTDESSYDLIHSRILSTKGKLSQAREIYSNEHPDIRRLELTLKNLDNELKNIAEYKNKPVIKADNPAYIQVKAQINNATSELSSLKQVLNSLYEKIDKYEARIIATPQIEREYKYLSRDYKNAVHKYKEIREKLLQANLAKELEKDRKGERFTIIEPPLFPESSESPNRLAIILLGFIFSIISGLASVSLFEISDPVVHGIKKLSSILGSAPLVTIPYIEVSGDAIGSADNNSH